MPVHAKILVNGMVQGVGYRYYARQEAVSLNLVGYVKNMPDGSVLSEVEGARGLVEAYINALKIGPQWSSVQGIHVTWDKSTGKYNSFRVTF